MNRKLDLTAVKFPTLELTLLDEENTVIHVKTPTMNKFREMQVMAAELEKADIADKDAVTLIYNFLADLLSCNKEGLVITADELAGKYNVDVDAAFLIYKEYLGFLNDIAAEKN